MEPKMMVWKMIFLFHLGDVKVPFAIHFREWLALIGWDLKGLKILCKACQLGLVVLKHKKVETKRWKLIV